MSQEHHSHRRFSESISSRFFPQPPIQPGIPTSHLETPQGIRLISLGEPITPFLPKEKAWFDHEGTPWTETTFVVDSQLRLPSGRRLPLLPITLSTVGDGVSARIKQDYLKAVGLVSPSPIDEGEQVFRPGVGALLSGLAMTLDFPHGERYRATPTLTGGLHEVDLAHGFVSYTGFSPLQEKDRNTALYILPLTPTEHHTGVRDLDHLFYSRLTMTYKGEEAR